MRKLAQQAVDAAEARKGEILEEWADRLAADSVAAGEAEYGPNSVQRMNEAGIRERVKAGTISDRAAAMVIGVDPGDPCTTEATIRLSEVVAHPGAAMAMAAELKQSVRVVNDAGELVFIAHYHGADPCPDYPRIDPKLLDEVASYLAADGGEYATDLRLRLAALEARPETPRVDLEILIRGILRADEALNIDMGDGEPTYQCCNAVCGHATCAFGEAFQHLREKDLIFWDLATEKWKRSSETGSDGDGR